MSLQRAHLSQAASAGVSSDAQAEYARYTRQPPSGCGVNPLGAGLC
jgi:hypothetical protein